MSTQCNLRAIVSCLVGADATPAPLPSNSIITSMATNKGSNVDNKTMAKASENKWSKMQQNQLFRGLQNSKRSKSMM